MPLNDHRPTGARPRPTRTKGQPGVGLAGIDRSGAGSPIKQPRLPLALTAGKRRRTNSCAGFTLLELIVVILLLTILLGFAIPAFQAGNAGGSRDRVARELAHTVRKLKIAALDRQIIHKLHLDLNQNRIWVTRGEQAAGLDDAPSSPQSERTLPEDIRIAKVRFADNREIRSGRAEIAFYPQGYSDRAIIRLTDKANTTVDLVVEAFLPMALMAEKDSAAVF